MKFANIYLYILMVLVMGISFCHPKNEYVKKDQILDAIQGEWQVYDGYGSHNDIRDMREFQHIGTLVLCDSSYAFLPKSGVTTSVGIRERFSFINQVNGNVTIEYWNDVNPDSSIESLKDHDILATCRFNNQTEKFLIRFNKEKNQLYFHAIVSEFQLYQIIR